jgi:hypothetical protein
MITQEQAEKIIALLEKIESNTSSIETYVYDVDKISKNVEEIKNLLENKE